MHALFCMLPFFQVCAILWMSSVYSQFWEEYTMYFLFGVGMLITSMTGNLNLKSCAQVKYNPVYLDPFLFVAILYCDYNRLFESHIIAYMYIALVVERAITYFLFVRNMVNQLCDHLEIPFLQVKQGWKKSK